MRNEDVCAPWSASTAAQLKWWPNPFELNFIEMGQAGSKYSAPTSRRTASCVSSPNRKDTKFSDSCQEQTESRGYDGKAVGNIFSNGDDGRAVLKWLSSRFGAMRCQGWAKVLSACPATPSHVARVRSALGENCWIAAQDAVRDGAR